MDNHTATEIAYKNGYEQGKKDAVVHGRWGDWTYSPKDGVLYRRPCTSCGYLASEHRYYCPNCGAKMDGGEVNA